MVGLLFQTTFPFVSCFVLGRVVSGPGSRPFSGQSLSSTRREGTLLVTTRVSPEGSSCPVVHGDFQRTEETRSHRDRPGTLVLLLDGRSLRHPTGP